MCLRSWGFQNINVVPEQMVVDGNFPTVVSPNPENAEAMTLGMKLGTKLNADLVVATERQPDCHDVLLLHHRKQEEARQA